ncbi:MAG: DUF167 domain-containing protein [Candidatus Paceibacterota bacterium]
MKEKLITVRVSAGSRSESVERLAADIYKVHVRTVPEKGKANKRVLELIAEHFGVAKSRLEIVRGGVGREKKIRIDMA